MISGRHRETLAVSYVPVPGGSRRKAGLDHRLLALE